MKRYLLALLACFMIVPALADNTRAGESSSLSFAVPQSGEYYLALTFQCERSSVFTNVATVRLMGETWRVPLHVLWEDDKTQTVFDRYGNEIPPGQHLRSGQNTVILQDHTSLSGRYLRFRFDAGPHTVELSPENNDIEFLSVEAIPVQPIPAYADYGASYAGAPSGGDFLVIEAEDISYKNDSYIRGTSSKNTATVPYDALTKRINVIDDKSFNAVGQEIFYEFEINAPGLYTLAFKYSQPLKAGLPVFRTITVDGEIPFAECMDVPFPHTGMNVYQNLVMDQQVYLDAGRHTLSLAVTAGPIEDAYVKVMEAINEMNILTLKIKKLTGQNTDVTSNVDTNRTWNIVEYLPTILDDLDRWQAELDSLYQTMRTIGDGEPSFANDLRLAIRNLRELAKDPSRIPGRISLLADDASSAAQLLGTLLPKLSEQNLSLDRIYIYDGKRKLPDTNESFFAAVGVGLRKFFNSFSPLMNESVSRRNAEGTLTVWVNKSSQYVEALRELCAQTFTVETGINVSFSIMPMEDKIILANASGSNPDVALCISYYQPYNFAVRGMAKNLLEYDGFLDFYESQYNLESLVPMSYDGGVYGASDSQDFMVLFYRKDILKALGIPVPQTMDDVRAMMPTLHRNAMNFSVPLSTDKEGYKSFVLTMPFVYQNGGDFYSGDGMSAGLDNPDTIKGLKEMCDLYRVYGAMINIKSFFNSFRSGSIPIGISNFATYLQLSIAAPEMVGLWDIDLVPGTKNDSGEILRYQSADSTAAMIFANTEMPDEAYRFLRWWLDADTQTLYANNLQRKYGPNYFWNTANLLAFENMYYPRVHRDVILTMWRDWQLETPRHVASYMLEREVSNIWEDVVRDGAWFQPRVDEAQITINREMVRKLEEFGYLDDSGNVLKPYIVNTIEQIRENRK